MELEGKRNSGTLAAFLQQLRQRYGGPRKVILDSSSAHPGEAMREYLPTAGLSLGLGEGGGDRERVSGLLYLDTRQERYKTTSRLERLNRELRRREKMGTVWSIHHLLALLEIRGLLNQTT